MAIERWRWVQKQDIGPSSRYAFSMAYDSHSRRVILFGGANEQVEIQNDTWEWVDQFWIQVADTGPLRGGHDMAHDSKRDRIVLFGGTDNVLYKNDTWEWDGNEWVQVADTGPSNRTFHSMVYDTSEKEMLLFGGYDPSAMPNPIFGDTWKLKDNVWIKAQDMGSGPLALADMIYTGKRAVLFGGLDGTVTNQDTWDWKGTLWVQRQNMGPPARAWHSMAYDSDMNRVVLFGGINEMNTFFGDTWELTIKNLDEE
jgi:Galactose oxidase, central domain